MKIYNYGNWIKIAESRKSNYKYLNLNSLNLKQNIDNLQYKKNVDIYYVRHSRPIETYLRAQNIQNAVEYLQKKYNSLLNRR